MGTLSCCVTSSGFCCRQVKFQTTCLGPISWSPLRHNSVLTSTVKRRIYFMESVSKTYRLAEKFSANPDCFLLTCCQDTYKMAIGCRSRHYRGRLTFIEAKFYSLEFGESAKSL